MTLNITEQNKIKKDFSEEEFVAKKKTANVSTAEIVTEALNIDTFITTNLTAINNQFSVGFRAKTTVQQRLKLFKLVVARLELK